MTTADKLRRAQAARRDTLARMAVESDPEMCAWLEKVLEQWTIEITNLRKSRSFSRRIWSGCARWLKSGRTRRRRGQMISTLVRYAMAGVASWRD